MTRALDGKSAIITGGGGGFGKAIARRLVRDGARVLLTGRSLARLEAARARLLTDMPDADIAVLAGDAGDEQAVQAAVAAAGGGVLDIFIGTVGGGSGYGPIENVALDDFMADYRSNAASAFLAIKHGAPRMCDGGSFVFVSSTAAKLSFNRLASYCAAKAGLEQLVRVAANELGSRGIRVNCVRPGLTHTDGLDAAFARPGYVDGFLPYIPLGRTGEPDDVAAAVAFLAGPDASWITGQSIASDGGNELRMAPL